MEALKAEARRIAAEIEEFSCRTAKEVAGLLTAISDIEDESDKKLKREKNIDVEIEALAREKEAIKLSLTENDKRFRSLSVKKNEMDKMIDIEMMKFRDRDREIKEILSRLSKPDPPKQANTPLDSQMIDFLRQAVAKKKEDLLCPVCLETAQIPIFTCPDSHIICSACVPKLKVQECPQCRVDLPTPLKRHRFAEMTAAELEELVQKMRNLTAIDPHPDLEVQESRQDSLARNVPAEPPSGQTGKTWATMVRHYCPWSGDQRMWQPKTKPEGFSKEEDMRQLFVSNVPHNCISGNTLSELFSKFGKVTNVWINADDPRAFVPKFGFIEFESRDCVERALAVRPILLHSDHTLNVEPKVFRPLEASTQWPKYWPKS